MELVSTLHAAFHAANKALDESVSELGFAPKSMILYHSPLVNVGGRKMKNMSNERVVMISIVPAGEGKIEVEIKGKRVLVWEINI